MNTTIVELQLSGQFRQRRLRPGLTEQVAEVGPEGFHGSPCQTNCEQVQGDMPSPKFGYEYYLNIKIL